MADDFTFNIDGLESLLGKLEEVTVDVKKRGGRSALRKAAQLLRDKVKENAARIDNPATAADISKNAAERWNGKLFKQTGDLGFRVGILGGAGGNKTSAQLSGLPGGDTRHWRYLEFGTEDTAAQPFMRPALTENSSQITSVFVTEYEKALDRAIKRAKKKAAQGG